MSRHDWRRYRRQQHEAGFQARPVDERIIIFRRNLVSTALLVGVLAGVNLLTTPEIPWFLFAALGMGASVMKQWSGLWAEGVTWKRIFRKPDPRALAGESPASYLGGVPAPPGPLVAQLEAARLAPRDVLDGPRGDAVRRAAEDKVTILSIVDSLGAEDRNLIPDVVPTVDGLAQRAASVAQMLHHLDRDLSPNALAQLEERMAAVRREPPEAVDRERRLSLLERQQASLRQLTTRHERLVGQLESVGIALQNLKLDLLKLRSSGVQSAIGEVNSATVEARALSRDIGHVLEAADEVRKLS